MMQADKKNQNERYNLKNPANALFEAKKSRTGAKNWKKLLNK